MADAATLPYQEIVTYGGMLMGAAVAAALVRLGWKQKPVPETDIALSGQVAVTNLQPVRDLLKQVDLLTLQMQKAVVSIERQTSLHTDTVVKLGQLADLLGSYLAMQQERQETEDRAKEIAQGVAEELEKLGVKPRPRGRVSE